MVKVSPKSRHIAIAMHAHRLAKGLSQRELADRVGISQSIVSGFESGRSDSQLSTVTAIAAALGLELMVVSERDVRRVQQYLGIPATEPPLSVFDEVFVPDPDEDEDGEP